MTDKPTDLPTREEAQKLLCQCSGFPRGEHATHCQDRITLIDRLYDVLGYWEDCHKADGLEMTEQRERIATLEARVKEANETHCPGCEE